MAQRNCTLPRPTRRTVLRMAAALLCAGLLLFAGYRLPKQENRLEELQATAEVLLHSYGWTPTALQSQAEYTLGDARGIWTAASLNKPYTLSGISFDLDALYDQIPEMSGDFYYEYEQGKWQTTVYVYQYALENPFDTARPLIAQLCFYDDHLGIARVYPDAIELAQNVRPNVFMPSELKYAWALDTPKDQLAAEYTAYITWLKEHQKA